MLDLFRYMKIIQSYLVLNYNVKCTEMKVFHRTNTFMFVFNVILIIFSGRTVMGPMVRTTEKLETTLDQLW